MRDFVTADTHFYHRNILDYSNKGFASIEEMNESLVERWNHLVSKDDHVFHLGDFGLSKKETLKKIREKLNGKITLVMGNHDYQIKKKHWIETIGMDAAVEFVDLPDYFLVHFPDFFQLKTTRKPILCGHVHGLWKESGNLINVGVDVNNFEPVLLSEVS